MHAAAIDFRFHILLLTETHNALSKYNRKLLHKTKTLSHTTFFMRRVDVPTDWPESAYVSPFGVAAKCAPDLMASSTQKKLLNTESGTTHTYSVQHSL